MPKRRDKRDRLPFAEFLRTRTRQNTADSEWPYVLRLRAHDVDFRTQPEMLDWLAEHKAATPEHRGPCLEIWNAYKRELTKIPGFTKFDRVGMWDRYYEECEERNHK